MDKNIGLMEAIEIAMEAERKAQQFYTDAAAKVASRKGKNLLNQLADFERNHYSKLNDLKNSLNREGKFVKYEGTEFTPFKASAEISGTIEPNKDEVLDILSMAIDAEEKAHKHYARMAEETTDPDGKDMFEKLADEELTHRRILSDEFYSIANKGGTWAWGE